MSDEYEIESTSYSPFYPILILLVGIILWSGYQVFAANSQRSVYEQQFQQAVPALTQAQNVKDRYVALMKDLIETSQKDANAAQIVKEAMAAGLLRSNPNPAPGADGSTNAAPADAGAGAGAGAPAPATK